LQLLPFQEALLGKHGAHRTSHGLGCAIAGVSAEDCSRVADPRESGEVTFGLLQLLAMDGDDWRFGMATRQTQVLKADSPRENT
jgi:hypothetical protein